MIRLFKHYIPHAVILLQTERMILWPEGAR